MANKQQIESELMDFVDAHFTHGRLSRFGADINVLRGTYTIARKKFNDPAKALAYAKQMFEESDPRTLTVNRLTAEAFRKIR